MGKSILVTAVAGSGKTTVCKVLCDLGYNAYDIESIPGLFSLIDKKSGKPMIKQHNVNLDSIEQGNNWNCDKTKMQMIIDKENADVTYYCGGASNIKRIRSLFDVVIVLRVSDKTTLTRLGSRTPGQFGSTSKVRKWVLSWKQEIEEEWLSAGGIEVDAEENPIEVAQAVALAAQNLVLNQR
jgi:hypothetical protein